MSFLAHRLRRKSAETVAPNLQAEGATVAVTTGVPSVVIPTHQANDILVLVAVYWGPNTVGDVAAIPTPSGWSPLGAAFYAVTGAAKDGVFTCFYLRATGAGSTVTMTRGAAWDDGSDTCFAARAYVVRGCVTSGVPYDGGGTSGPHTAANQAFLAITVGSNNHTVIQFGGSMDDAAFSMAATGWTTGTEDNDPTGTGCSFQVAYKEDVSSSTSDDAATAAAPAQGAYFFRGVSFTPV